uniref:Uncharacterized protein n=1 Tax=Anguilla anguilla TaxID=7936 RepID=A0A0E9RE60_ANGAN
MLTTFLLPRTAVVEGAAAGLVLSPLQACHASSASAAKALTNDSFRKATTRSENNRQHYCVYIFSAVSDGFACYIALERIG